MTVTIVGALSMFLFFQFFLHVFFKPTNYYYLGSQVITDDILAHTCQHGDYAPLLWTVCEALKSSGEA